MEWVGCEQNCVPVGGEHQLTAMDHCVGWLGGGVVLEAVAAAEGLVEWLGMGAL